MGFFEPNVKKQSEKRNVDGLIKSLQYQKNSNVRREAAEALGKIEDTKAVGPLIRALNDNSDNVRENVAWALGKIGGVKAVESLIGALKDNEKDVISVVVEALVKIGESSVETLVVALKDRCESIRINVADVLDKLGWSPTDQVEQTSYFLTVEDWDALKIMDKLIKIGKPATETLIDALEYEGEFVRKNAAEALGKIGEVQAVEPLIEILKDDDMTVRSVAVDALSNIGKPAVETLISAMKDTCEHVRWSTAEALGKTEDTRAVEPLISVLKDACDQVRSNAAMALGKIGDSKALKPLIRALNDKCDNVRENAAWALGNTRNNIVVQSLIYVMKDKNKHVRRKAIEALGKIGDTKAVQPLIAALNHDTDMRSVVSEILVKIGKPVVEPLIKALEYNVAIVRGLIVVTLVKIGTPAVESLIATLKNQSERIRRHATDALSEIGWSPRNQTEQISYLITVEDWVPLEILDKLVKIGKPAVEPLIDALQYEGTFIRQNAARALGIIKDERAINPLIELLKDKSSNVSTQALNSLLAIDPNNKIGKEGKKEAKKRRKEEEKEARTRKENEEEAWKHKDKNEEKILFQSYDSEALFEKGVDCSNQNNYEQAITYYKKALTIKPEYPEAYFNIGIAFHKLGRNSEAVEAYKRCFQYVSEACLIDWVPYIGRAVATINDIERNSNDNQLIRRLYAFMEKYRRGSQTPGGGNYSDVKDCVICIFEVGHLNTEEAITALKDVHRDSCFGDISLAVELTLKRLGRL